MIGCTEGEARVGNAAEKGESVCVLFLDMSF